MSEVSTYVQCTRCVLDNVDDPQIIMDEAGICNYCRRYEYEEDLHVKKGQDASIALDAVVAKIKKAGIGKPYDCILGVSGGVDSTYLAYKAKELGLRVLAVHFDNGWNSELAVKNIEKILSNLDIDLYTYVVDWNEFKDLQLAFLKASVIDIELATDHAMLATLYRLALKKKVKFILSGHNIVTEQILPKHWYFNKRDHIHIRAISERFGSVPLKTYPLLSSWLKFSVEWRRIQSIALLNYLPYNKKAVKQLITEKLGWKDYGGKHYESIFTRFYQGYILPKKFGVDKRKAHLSNLICSNQLTRDEALEELKTPPYKPEQLSIDFEFVLKKLELTREAFEELMQKAIKDHEDYPTDVPIYDRFFVLKLLAPFWKFFKITREKIAG